jgi:hypothetical protein
MLGLAMLMMVVVVVMRVVRGREARGECRALRARKQCRSSGKGGGCSRRCGRTKLTRLRARTKTQTLVQQWWQVARGVGLKGVGLKGVDLKGVGLKGVGLRTATE